MLVLLLVSLLSGILAVAGLPSAVVDAVMFLLSLLQLASLHAVTGFTVTESIPAFRVHTACVGAPVVAYIPSVAFVPAVAMLLSP
jgi:hypothetical protein